MSPPNATWTERALRSHLKMVRKQHADCTLAYTCGGNCPLAQPGTLWQMRGSVTDAIEYFWNRGNSMPEDTYEQAGRPGDWVVLVDREGELVLSTSRAFKKQEDAKRYADVRYQGRMPIYVALLPQAYTDDLDPSKPEPGADTPDNPIANALAVLRDAFQTDADYARAWHDNLACCVMDEGVSHAVANKAAARFMKLAFDVDTADFAKEAVCGWPSPGEIYVLDTLLGIGGKEVLVTLTTATHVVFATVRGDLGAFAIAEALAKDESLEPAATFMVSWEWWQVHAGRKISG
mgnify:CR=1 FL=1